MRFLTIRGNSSGYSPAVIFGISISFVITIVGAFASCLAPHDPRFSVQDNVGLHPAWYEPEISTVQRVTDNPLDLRNFPVRVDKSLGEAAEEFGINPEGLDSQEAVEEAFLEQGLRVRLFYPTWSHPFGGDRLGRDLLSTIMHGLRLPNLCRSYCTGA